ncbi:hypothetical protein DPMN_125230 [Dreissena polymorpha]|uniref:Neurotoxin n=1 Tax=Dreissena polymorpha TaxID=45954 RepID=A0A9D4JTB4_DREPO|nr:hypothetical protein DPMN_125230 [Dreissena polymorpha]
MGPSKLFAVVLIICLAGAMADDYKEEPCKCECKKSCSKGECYIKGWKKCPYGKKYCFEFAIVYISTM